jgi:hypothetical protein
VRDEKMLEKLATHDVQDVSELFNLANKCTRATEGRVWHLQLALEAGNVGKPDADAAALSRGKNKKKKKKASGNNKPLAGAPAIATAAVVAGQSSGSCGDKKP